MIPPKSNRNERRHYDRRPSKLRLLVESGILEFKRVAGCGPLCQESGVILGRLPTPGMYDLE